VKRRSEFGRIEQCQQSANRKGAERVRDGAAHHDFPDLDRIEAKMGVDAVADRAS
jgi:hypothetical protein